MSEQKNIREMLEEFPLSRLMNLYFSDLKRLNLEDREVEALENEVVLMEGIFRDKPRPEQEEVHTVIQRHLNDSIKNNDSGTAKFCAYALDRYSENVLNYRR